MNNRDIELAAHLDLEPKDVHCAAEVYGHLSSLGYESSFAAQLCKSIDSVPQHVLDAGAGLGTASLHLATALGTRCVAVDLSRPLCEEIDRRLYTSEANGPISIVQADIRELPFALESFDLVVLSSVDGIFRSPNEMVQCLAEYTSAPGHVLYLRSIATPVNDLTHVSRVMDTMSATADADIHLRIVHSAMVRVCDVRAEQLRLVSSETFTVWRLGILLQKFDRES